MIKIPIKTVRPGTNLPEFTFSDFAAGIVALLATPKPHRNRCKVHAMHKPWVALWPVNGLGPVNLANNEPVKVCGWIIEFDWDQPQTEAHFG